MALSTQDGADIRAELFLSLPQFQHLLLTSNDLDRDHDMVIAEATLMLQ